MNLIYQTLNVLQVGWGTRNLSVASEPDAAFGEKPPKSVDIEKGAWLDARPASLRRRSPVLQ